MKNVKILDCTLRDGGRIVNCEFPDNEIKEITKYLVDAKIDIIEVGFLRSKKVIEYKRNSTFFTDVNQICPFLDKNKKDVMYVAFIDYGMFDISDLKPYDGKSIDGIRFGFTKRDFDNNYDDILKCMRIIKENGYKLFIQGVNSLNYSEKEILELVDLVNEVHPYSFGIVDTYGAMYVDDVDRIYGLIDRNMDSDICINFHSHNNYQLSFALAQEVIRLSNGIRKVIIDATLGGMGKVAGNLNTELIVDFLARKKQYDYNLDDILDVIDDYIYKYSLKYKWGYSVPAMMAGIYKSHPNNIIYLTEKFRLESKDIGNILSLIEPQMRQQYDYDNIEQVYIEYIANKVDDNKTITKLKEMVSEREVLVLVPGHTLNTHKDLIFRYIMTNHPLIISVNFISEYDDSWAFFGNQKRYNIMKEKRSNQPIIISSNINGELNDMVVNYYSIISQGHKYFENSTIMLLKLLGRLDVQKIAIAGFDGFDVSLQSNYTDSSFQNDRHIGEFEVLNAEIMKMYKDFVDALEGKCDVKLITPSRYHSKE